MSIVLNGSTGITTPDINTTTLNVNNKDVKSKLLAEYEVTGSAVTSIDFSGLDINTHKSYRVEIDILNATGSNSDVSLFVNNDTTQTNYYTQVFGASATTVSAARYNSNIAISLLASTRNCMTCFVSIISGYYKTRTLFTRGEASIESHTNVISKTSSITNITQLTLVSSIAKAIGIGSKVRIYRGDV